MRDFVSKFKQVVKKYPKNIAVLTDGKEILTYRELYNASVRVAKLLKSKNIGKEDVVAISIRKSPEYIISLLATWFAGAAFMPLAPSLPKERKGFLLQDANPSLILIDSEGSEPLPPGYAEILNIRHALRARVQEIEIGTPPLPQDLAYLIYTSGSTGAPKGVLVKHSGIVNVLEEQIKCFKLAPSSRSLFFLSINFDASISDIGTVLLSGAALCIETADSLEVAARLPEILTERKITHIDMPPSLLEILDIKKIPRYLKTIIIGGESAGTDIVRKWAKKLRLVNAYGPTEATICTSMVVCDPDTWDGPDIGMPVANMEYKILDFRGEEAPIGQSGELFISGIGLARGYLNNDELNKEKFVSFDGNRCFRTGDIVRRTDDKIYFIGRSDRQVKIRGQLVAPEEIEVQLQSHKNISRAAVIASKNEGPKARNELAAFIEIIKSIDSEEIKEYLRKKLPAWMIPRHVAVLKKIPVNESGKIDYEKLKNLSGKPALHQETAEIADRVALKLKEIWQKVLNRSGIGIDEDFFSLGGDSLSVLQVITEAGKYGINIPVGLLSELTTIREVANWHKGHKNKAVSDGVAAKKLEKDAALTAPWKKLLEDARPLPSSTGGDILLTGATGFLGVHLLHELLEHTEKKVYSLIRASDKAAALERIKNTAKKYGVELTGRQIERIKPLTGDASKYQLGLRRADWQSVSERVSHIYHCAGIVNMIKNYEELKPANADSVKEIVKLALTGTKKKVNYASTLSVFVATDKNTGVVLESDDLHDTRVIYGGYAQSKWAAERFLQQITREMTGINIFRFGLITGDSQTGIYSSHDYLEMFVRGVLSLGSAPKGDHSSIRLDVTPVDYAAKAMAYIGAKSRGGCYHISNVGGFTLQMILEALQARGLKIKQLPPKEWLDIIKSRKLNARESVASMALCRLLPQKGAFEQLRSMDLFQATNIIFDQTNTRKYLKNTKIVIPKPNRILLNKYIDKIL